MVTLRWAAGRMRFNKALVKQLTVDSFNTEEPSQKAPHFLEAKPFSHLLVILSPPTIQHQLCVSGIANCLDSDNLSRALMELLAMLTFIGSPILLLLLGTLNVRLR